MRLRLPPATWLAAVVSALWGAVGCPVFLSDDFERAHVDAKDAGGGHDDGGGSAGASLSMGGGAAGGTGAIGSGGSSGTGGTGGSVTPTGGTGGGGDEAGNKGGSGGAAGAFDAGSLDAGARGWAAIADPPASFAPREKPAYAALGTGVFIWGGADRTGTELASGALYDARSDRWTLVPNDASTPSPRVLATAVWTGKVMLVWGGGDAQNLADYGTGARYDPVSGWSPMSSAGAPPARRAPSAYWVSSLSKALFWGGVTAVGNPVAGAYLYDPSNDAWTAASTANEPTPPLSPDVGFNGSSFVVYGGRSAGKLTAHTDVYDVTADSWAHYPDGPQGRTGAFGCWDGDFFIAWAGSVTNLRGDGEHLSMSGTPSWKGMTTRSAPLARYVSPRETGWSARVTDHTTLVLGGYGASQTPLSDGGLYDSSFDVWNAVPPWASGNAHLWGVGLWAGTEFVLWSGRVALLGSLESGGERYRP